jgi:hypothetical protein
MHIRITATPAGEAPLEVRQKWVGLTLPLAAGHREARSFMTSGVLTGPKSFFAVVRDFLLGRLAESEGYVVDATTALEILSKHDPSAAEWWRNSAPHLLRRHRKLVFQAAVCELLDQETVFSE